MLPVVYLPKADAHLRQIEQCIAEQAGPAIAERYVRRITERCDLIAALPYGGRLRKTSGLRSLAFKGRVTIFYIVTDQAIVVAGVKYGKQDEGRFLASLRA